MLNIDSTKLQGKPFPHLVQRELFDPEFYKELKATYPDFGKADIWSRMSKDLMRGDAIFAQTVSRGAWKTFFDYLNSPKFLGTMTGLFKDGLQSKEFLVSPNAIRLVDHVETREWIATHKVSQAIAEFQGAREEVFVRMDFGIGEKGYKRPPHLDWRHRVCSLLVYFDDPKETKMDGGHLLIHKRHGNQYLTSSVIEHENNMGVFKLDNNDSYHSVTEVAGIQGQRKTLYIAVSSRGQVWKPLTPA